MEATRITTKEIQKTQELIDFIKKSPSCYHVIHNIAAELEEAGYEQLNEAKGIPQSIASYYVTRNIYNAYRKVTVNNSNPREVLYKYNTEINNELERKREEFGLKGESGK